MSTARTWARARRLARDFAGDCRGAPAVEFALILPILIIITLATVDFSMYTSAQIELEQALRAGGQYALLDPSATTTIENAVTGATDMTGITVSVGSMVCECPGGATAVCRGGSGFTTCAGGVSPAGFIVINGTATFTPLFAGYLPWFSSTMPLSQNVTLRVY